MGCHEPLADPVWHVGRANGRRWRYSTTFSGVKSASARNARCVGLSWDLSLLELHSNVDIATTFSARCHIDGTVEY